MPNARAVRATSCSSSSIQNRIPILGRPRPKIILFQQSGLAVPPRVTVT
ncbi:hypothetical protein RHECNPAF_2330067 [Rhizobium etli CNPAF512]|nr:hypothetical protein RHECNPAF_2330067 [Rhizobium etli CNPAF512]